jgi:adenine-specific DNA-methyltransferase
MRLDPLELRWPGKGPMPRVETRVLLAGATFGTPPDARLENALIKGDNLLALAALRPELTGAVKCAFIDPPYNTGSAFAHYDDGLEHSAWLSLMAPRIAAIHDLLSEDGSLWISIDDNESHYLKVLCDEIFGRQNFVANVIWQKKYTVANDAKWFSDNHDHILVYAKNKLVWRPNKLPRTDEMNARYANPDNHPKGPWKATPLHAKSGSDKNKNFSYRFRNGREWAPPPGTFPRFSEATLAELDAAGAIWFGRDGTAQPSRKTFLSELSNDGIVPLTVWLNSEVGHNHEAKTEAKAFNAQDVFSTPKPERLLHRIIHMATKPGDLVLDSFAGSGTTGAVAHKMGRRWLMIELNDHAETHIVPRLEAVVDGSDQGGVSSLVGWTGGDGFRTFRLGSSLLERDRFGQWVFATDYDRERLIEAVCLNMGYRFRPSDEHWWMHGQSSESDFIYVTEASLTADQLVKIAEEVGPERTLLICCKAFQPLAKHGCANLTVKRIPQALLDRCEWGRDDYSFEVTPLIWTEDDEEEDDGASSSVSVGDPPTPDLLAGLTSA